MSTQSFPHRSVCRIVCTCRSKCIAYNCVRACVCVCVWCVCVCVCVCVCGCVCVLCVRMCVIVRKREARVSGGARAPSHQGLKSAKLVFFVPILHWPRRENIEKFATREKLPQACGCDVFVFVGRAEENGYFAVRIDYRFFLTAMIITF